MMNNKPSRRRSSTGCRGYFFEVLKQGNRREFLLTRGPLLPNMQGVIIIHLVLLTFFCFKATSSLASWPTRRAANSTASSMRISTYNLRFDSMPDSITVQQSLSSLPDPLVAPAFLGISGEQPWSTRRIKVAEHLLHEGVVMASA